MIAMIFAWANFVNVHRNPIDLNCTSDRALLRLIPKRMRRKLTNETWEQIKTAYAAGINLREIARKMNISEGTVTAHATRLRWSQQIQVATREPTVMQSDAFAPMQPLQPVPQSDTIAPLKNTIAPAQNTQSVPLSVAAILAER
jgi:transposase-like protein